MKYSVGECLADTGFTFLEKIHEPIFLVHRLRGVARMNEAGRKLLSIAKVPIAELDKFAFSCLQGLFQARQEGYRRLKVGNSRLHLVARSLKNSDFILVEVKR